MYTLTTYFETMRIDNDYSFYQYISLHWLLHDAALVIGYVKFYITVGMFYLSVLHPVTQSANESLGAGYMMVSY